MAAEAEERETVPVCLGWGHMGIAYLSFTTPAKQGGNFKRDREAWEMPLGPPRAEGLCHFGWCPTGGPAPAQAAQLRGSSLLEEVKCQPRSS